MDRKTNFVTYHDAKLPDIIMIHGYRGTHHGMDLIAKELTQYHVIVPDLPGFGETPALNTEHNITSYVMWLKKFIEKLDLKESPILLGHSFGSIVSSAYAAQYPTSIKKLILVNPIGAPALEGPKAILTNLAIFYYWLGEKMPERLANKWLGAKSVVMIMSITMAKTKDKKKRQYIHSEHLKHFSSFQSARVASEAFKASVSNNVRDSAAQVSSKTLLIAGEKDDITPLSKQHELQSLFQDAQLQIISNVGHLTHYETPKEVAKLVESFISQ